MKYKWTAVAISLVFLLCFSAAPSWARGNHPDRGFHSERHQKFGYNKGKKHSFHCDRHHYSHKCRDWRKHSYKRHQPFYYRHHKRVYRHHHPFYHRHHRPIYRHHQLYRHGRAFFGLSFHNPCWGFSFRSGGLR